MRKLSALVCFGFFVKLGYSQNTFPTTGNVGIGTTTPATLLNLVTSNTSTDYTTDSNAPFTFSNTNTTPNNMVSFAFLGAVPGTAQAYNAGIGATFLRNNPNAGADMWFWTRSSADATLGKRLTIKDNGNIGIGTTTPGNLLHVYKSGTGYVELLKVQNPGDPGNGATRLSVANSQSSFLLQAYGSGAPGSLANAASIYAATGSKLLFGAGTGMGIQFFANDLYTAPQFTLTSGGNVGIGTTTPVMALDIISNASNQLHIQTTNANSQAGFYLENNRGSYASYGGFAIGGSTSSGLGNIFGLSRVDRLFMFSDGASSAGMVVGTISAQPLSFGTNNVERIRVNSAGLVGIGALYPTNLIHVSGDMRLGSSLDDINGANVSSTGRLLISNGTTGSAIIRGNHLDNNNVGLTFQSFKAGSSFDAIVIAPSGVVSIGSPATVGTLVNDLNNKFFVNGNIVTKKIKVTQTWADYVFDPNYNLATLQQVDAFIQTNKHLPSIPTAASIEKEGLDLGEMQKLMMQKIEELTLYIIQQDKRIKELETKDKK
ncbi:MAG: hypothetical protein V4722_06915 [Bacteroidota bacterium]